MRVWLLLLGLLQMVALAQPKKVLYITHSAGYRHDSLPLSQQVIKKVAARTGKLDVTATDDVSELSDLSSYSAVVFFTSGELPLTTTQKDSLLSFVRNGGGFAGFHSATDTFYTWPEYGELIGARFDGHPWVQEVGIDIEDPDHPAMRNLTPSFRIIEEIYQFREFSRDRVRVLMTLDTHSADIRAPSVNRTDGDFALAWTREYGRGRVFYNALGHFEDTWRDSRFQQSVEQALLWITGQLEGEAQPRSVVRPSIAQNGVGNAATMQPPMTISPGSFVSIYGANLTSGASMASDVRTASYRLAGTRVTMNGADTAVVYASPEQLNVLAPLDLDAGDGQSVEVAINLPSSVTTTVRAAFAQATPGIFVATNDNRSATLWATGLGVVRRSGDLFETVAKPMVLVNSQPAAVLFSGLAPGWPGLYQVNVELPADVMPPYTFTLTSAPSN